MKSKTQPGVGKVTVLRPAEAKARHVSRYSGTIIVEFPARRIRSSKIHEFNLVEMVQERYRCNAHPRIENMPNGWTVPSSKTLAHPD